MSIRHAAVWLDHEQARVFHVDPETFEHAELHATHHLHHPHKTGGPAELHRSSALDHPFFDDIAKHLADVEEILVVGPSQTKLDFVKFAQEKHKDLARKIVAIEPADHPTDKQIVAHARLHFFSPPLRIT